MKETIKKSNTMKNMVDTIEILTSEKNLTDTN